MTRVALARPRPAAVVAALLATVLLPSVAVADDVLAGIDLWTTPPGGTTHTALALPPDFFDPGSDPFFDRPVLGGVPLPPLGGPPIFPADTVVRRLDDAILPGPGSEDTVPIEILALSLVSVQPITVTYDGGQNPELWDVEVCLSDQPQALGTITIRKDYDAGGTFDAQLPVRPKLVFVRQNDLQVRVLDPGPAGQIDFEVLDQRWVHVPENHLNVVQAQPGAITDGNCDGVPDLPLPGSSNFAAGVWSLADECLIPAEPQVKVLSPEEAMLAAHGVVIAQDPPPDGDGDSVGDDADNCPNDFNPLQEDFDNDTVGDLCDNCFNNFNPCQEDGDGDGHGDVCEIFEDGFESGDLTAWSGTVP